MASSDRALGSNTKLLEVVPFLAEMPVESRRRVAASASSRGETKPKPVSRLRVADIADSARRRSVSEVLAIEALDEVVDVRLRRLVPTLKVLKGTFVRYGELSPRSYKALLEANLLRWDDLIEASPNGLRDLQGIGRQALIEILALAINRGIRLTVEPSDKQTLGDSGAENYSLGRGAIDRDLVLNLLLDFVNGLPASSIAISQPGQTRQVLLQWGREKTIGELRRYLSAATRGEDIPRILSARKRRQALDEALIQFDRTIEHWARGLLWDSKVKWLVPEGTFRTLSVTNPKRLRTDLRACSPLGQQLSVSDGVARWIPVLSIDGIAALKKFQTSDPPELLTALGRACKQVAADTRPRPWEPRFPPKIAALPLGYLYQFSPTRRAQAAIKRLANASANNVGNLRILHPECLRLARAVPLVEWIELRRRLTS